MNINRITKLKLNLISIPILTDNYVWLLSNYDRKCLVIDPGDAIPVLNAINNYKITPIAILLTHHHQDHTKGINDITKYFSVPVYGPKETILKGITKIVKEGDDLFLLNNMFKVVALPGHTLGHIGFYSAPILFCGDTVFSAGCGRPLEGTSKQLYKSLQKINKFPLNTLICAAHEYTLDNLNFANSILPKYKPIINYRYKIKEKLAKKKPTLPTTLNIERKINLFFRCYDISLQNKLNIHPSLNQEWLVFAKLREKKDKFNN